MATLSQPVLQELLTEVRVLLNQRDPYNSNWSDKELTNWISEAARTMHKEMTMAREGYFEAQTTLDIVADTETIALPSDCFEVKTVYKVLPNSMTPLKYDPSSGTGYSTQGGSSANFYRPDYHIRGNNLVLRPTPNFSETGGISLEYVKNADVMVNAGDSLDTNIPMMYKDLLIMMAVYKAKLQQSMTMGNDNHLQAKRERDELWQQFKDAIVIRSSTPTAVKAFNPESEDF